MNIVRMWGLAMASLMIQGCSVWQDYVRPRVEIPAQYKELPPAGWKVAEPGSPALTAGWWERYNDPQLGALLTQANQANFTLRIAEANYRQGLALARASRAPQLPALNGQADASRGEITNTTGVRSDYSIGLNASWEMDLWGRIRNSVLAGEANAEASAADLAAAKLSVQSTLAQTYFQLRILDSQKLLLDNTAKSFERSLKLTTNRYHVGLASRTEIAQAETQLRNTLAQSIDISAARTQLEHAIAVLIGKAPAELSIPQQPYRDVAHISLPAVNAGLPASLLERRPDIAAAERRVASANAQIGVARAALFPTLTLGGTLGYRDNSLSNLLSLPNRLWSLGPALAGPIFDNQLRQSNTDAAIARYDATVATYQQTVINGLREVEDNLALLRILEAEAKEQETAVKFAREAVTQTENRYRAGIGEYQFVINVQSTLLNAERNLLAINGRRLNASVALMVALGGSDI